MAPTRCDAVILAGGRADPAMAEAAGATDRALFCWRGRTFVRATYDAVRAGAHVGRIVVVGPESARPALDLAEGDALLPERETISANLFAGVEATGGDASVLVIASDNPLLTGADLDDFLGRIPPDAALAYPLLPHAAFLREFPGADNIAVAVRDGVWIGGNCVWVRADARAAVADAIRRVLAARKSKARLVRLLGPWFAVRFALRWVTVGEVERRASAILGVPFRFVPDCSPRFAIDVDEPADLAYLERWAAGESAKRAPEP